VTPGVGGDGDQERARAARLLGVGGDPSLESAEPAPYPGPGQADWSVGYADRKHDVALTVWFVADPDSRSLAASHLEATGAQVVTNGGLLLAARSGRDDRDAARRLRRLMSRFAGDE
jgi:hypothetical protein